MLSRIAESLFWIGRYVERADGTARILDVHTQRLVEDPWIDERLACADLMALMGFGAPDGGVGVEHVLATLAFDASSASSIVGALSAARENARGVREILSAEIWESLNVTHNMLPQHQAMARRFGRNALFRFARERAALVFGLADSLMSRDEGWLFLVLGRSLERVDMTARILTTGVLAGDAASSWTLILRSTGGYEPYLRAYRGVVDSRPAAEFLLRDRLFPRSVFAALCQAEAALADLERSPVRDTTRIGVPGEAHRIVGRARTALEYMDTGELLAQLPARLDELERTCSLASAAVTERFFTEHIPQVWVPEGVV